MPIQHGPNGGGRRDFADGQDRASRRRRHQAQESPQQDELVNPEDGAQSDHGHCPDHDPREEEPQTLPHHQDGAHAKSKACDLVAATVRKHERSSNEGYSCNRSLILPQSEGCRKRRRWGGIYLLIPSDEATAAPNLEPNEEQARAVWTASIAFNSLKLNRGDTASAATIDSRTFAPNPSSAALVSRAKDTSCGWGAKRRTIRKTTVVIPREIGHNEFSERWALVAGF